MLSENRISRTLVQFAVNKANVSVLISWSAFLKKRLSSINFKYMVSVMLCITMAGCMDAATLGKEPAEHIVITGTPTWSNGIGLLMQVKCAGCHQVPRLASSPQNVTTDLDLRYEKNSGVIRSAEDIAAQISLDILQHDISYGNGNTGLNVTIRKMPLQFATPLYSDEISALKVWAGNVITAEQTNTSPVTVADGELLYKRHCQSCHGVYGGGGLVKKSLTGYTVSDGPTFAISILSPAYPMNTWPVLLRFANLCTLTGSPTTCSGTQLDAIAAYLAQF